MAAAHEPNGTVVHEILSNPRKHAQLRGTSPWTESRLVTLLGVCAWDMADDDHQALVLLFQATGWSTYSCRSHKMATSLGASTKSASGGHIGPMDHVLDGHDPDVRPP